jgi:squalene-hopene/tetraprenyl-beta-curcumene cyclase
LEREGGPEWQRKAVNHIFSMQLPTAAGTFIYGGPSEVNATIKAYLALKLAGVPVTDPRMLRAREVALQPGRRAAHEHLFQIVPRAARTVPVGIRADHSLRGDAHRQMVSREFLGHEQLVARHARAAGHHQPFQAHPPGKGGPGRACIPKASTNATSRCARPGKISWRNFFLWLDRLHKFAEWFAEHKIHPFRKTALKKCEQWMLERFEGSDGLAAIFPAMLNSLIASRRWAIPDDHPQVVRAAHELKKLEHETADSVRIEPCFSPVWDTAIVAICLHESGISGAIIPR